MSAVCVLDGPLGSALADAGVPTPPPLWSAAALRSHPGVVAALHAAQAAAGAQVLTAATFRTQPHRAPDWAALAGQAVALARGAAAAHPGVRVAGSIAPVEDCYRPDLSPADPRPVHRAVAQALAAAGCDLLLCEAFPHVGEGLVALEEAVATGRESWVSFTAGPRGDLLTPAQLAAGARAARERGAAAVLVNCVPAADTLRFVEALAGAGLPFGAYANAGAPEDGLGWGDAPEAAGRYLAHARAWAAAGATVIGACCGTPLAVTAALAGAFSGGHGGEGRR